MDNIYHGNTVGAIPHGYGILTALSERGIAEAGDYFPGLFFVDFHYVRPSAFIRFF